MEIERKFLVKSTNFPRTNNNLVMKQGYLSVDPERIVRIRTEGKNAWLTIKGAVKGFSRPEFEYPLTLADAEDLLKLALFPPIEKIRHRIVVQDLLWEVDEFLGANSGLIMAEVELENEEHAVELPDWIGHEVTCDKRYYNAWLAQHPYNTW